DRGAAANLIAASPGERAARGNGQVPGASEAAALDDRGGVRVGGIQIEARVAIDCRCAGDGVRAVDVDIAVEADVARAGEARCTRERGTAIRAREVQSGARRDGEGPPAYSIVCEPGESALSQVERAIVVHRHLTKAC